MKTLLLVESGPKAAKIQSYLGDAYIVMCTGGHLFEMRSSSDELGISISNTDPINFTPTFSLRHDKEYTAKKIIAAKRECARVFFAGDPDREGSFIDYSGSKVLHIEEPMCVKFNSISKKAILDAVAHPIPMHTPTVMASIARQIMDKLIGYKISPILWRTIAPRTSCGRVQTPAVRLALDVEDRISAFDFGDPANREFHTEMIDTSGIVYKLSKHVQSKPIPFIEACESFSFKISAITQKTSYENGSVPYTTSTYQQSMSSLFHINPTMSMIIAQQLYESGKITYPRTDSHTLSAGFITDLTNYILEIFGPPYSKKIVNTADKEATQGAHEAIRPVDVNLQGLNDDFSEEQKKVYAAIWKRTVAYGMASAVYSVETISALTPMRNSTFNCVNRILTFDGYLKLNNKDGPSEYIPVVATASRVGDPITVASITCTETIKKFPSRYTDATLVAELESKGIGRPATFAAIIKKIKDHAYVVDHDDTGTDVTLNIHKWDRVITSSQFIKTFGKESRKLKPTDLGRKIVAFVNEHFKFVTTYEFTAEMETKLDAIITGGVDWQTCIRELYGNLKPALDAIVVAPCQPRPESDVPTICNGKFSPYIAYQGRCISIKEPFDPDGLTQPEIEFLISLPKSLTVRDEPSATASLNVGRYGFYIKYYASRLISEAKYAAKTFKITQTKDKLIGMSEFIPPS
jgi:DNA topoisomerase-1